MEAYVKESLHVLDYKDNIVDTIFLSDDHMTAGYAYDITITEANTGYSDLKFNMPNVITNDQGNTVKNPKLALLTPLVKLRYHREVYYTGEQPITVREPSGYGDTVTYIDKTYSNQYPDNVIENYIMDYIVQPVDKKRDVLKLTTSFTAIDYPRFNLSKKRVGLNISQDTLTRKEWTLYQNKPMDVAGTIKYQEWTNDLTRAAGGDVTKVPLEWYPDTANEYPLNEDMITTLMNNTASWPYGLLGTAFYWPIKSTARFEGTMYKEGGFLVLQLYDFYSLTSEGVDPDKHVGRYAWDWTQLYEVDSYLTPNNACNYLYHILEGTNWSVKLREDGTPDVDIEQVSIPNPAGSTTSTSMTDHTCNISVSNSNCYNAITAVCQGLQLYPIYDCINREVSLRLFAGKNYGLTYRLGSNLTSNNVKTDGEKVITKLYVTGGKDYNGDQNINIGEAERSFVQTVVGVYDTIDDLPTPPEIDAYLGLYAVVKGNKKIEPKEPNVLYSHNGTKWEEISREVDGVFDPEGLNLDADTGLPAPWNPNDQEYAVKRSPYGTNYIMNFKWMYDNNWITKDEILDLYRINQEINDLNKEFMVPYTEDRLKTLQMYNDAVNNYDLKQGEYQSTLNSMMNKYYNVYGEYSEGTFYAFHKAPLGLHAGTEPQNQGKQCLWIGHCPKCKETWSAASEPVECACGNTSITVNEVYIPLYSDFKNVVPPTNPQYPYGPEITAPEYEPYLKGDYLKLLTTLDRQTPKEGEKDWTIEDYEGKISIITPIPYDGGETLDDREYKIEGVYVKASSGNIEEWNEDIEAFVNYYGEMLDALDTVNYCLEKLALLEEDYNKWKAEYDGYHAEIQEKYGDYLIEGNYTNSEQPYVGLLFNEGMEASDKYSVPEITYNLDVVDSSGLIEYRQPIATKYHCTQCDYWCYTPISICPKCNSDLIDVVHDTYNDLVHYLHSIGQIVPKAGDYVSIYDEPIGMFGVPGLITEISRTLDKPMNNRIKLDTAYTDDEELVGNIITATNTVLNNADIYARTAVLKADGTIDSDSIAQSIDNPNASLNIVGTNGNMLLTGSFLRFTDPNNSNKAIKYSGTGIFTTTTMSENEEATEWQKLITPTGINATYINAGQIDTKHISIMSGMTSKILIDQYGLVIKDKANKSARIASFDADKASTEAGYAAKWGTDNNISGFMGVDSKNNAIVYTKGYLVANKGSNIAGWVTDENSFYHLVDDKGTKDLWLSPTGVEGTVHGVETNYSLYVNGVFGVTPTGDLYSTSGKIGGWKIHSDKLTSTNSLSNVTGMSSSSFAGDPAFFAGGKDPWSNSNWQTETPFYVTNKGYLKATDANITGTITTNALTCTGGKITGGSINLGNGTFTVDNNGNMVAKSATIEGKITATSGTIGNCNINANGNLIIPSGHVSGTFSAGKISGGTLEGTNLLIYNKVGFLKMMKDDENHPYVSALNVATQGSTYGGISFRSSDDRNSVGSEGARLAYSGTYKQLYMYSSGNINVEGNNIALQTVAGSGGSSFIRIGTGELRIGLGDNYNVGKTTTVTVVTKVTASGSNVTTETKQLTFEHGILIDVK